MEGFSLAVLNEKPEGPQHDYHQVGRYSDPEELRHCTQCGDSVDAPQHLAWKQRIIKGFMVMAEQESSFNPNTLTTPLMPPVGIMQSVPSDFQAYGLGDGDVGFVFDPIKDRLKGFKPFGWSAKGITAFYNPDGSVDIYRDEDEDGTAGEY